MNTEYKTLTTILRELEIGLQTSNHMHLEPLEQAVENVVTILKDRKADLFNKGFTHEVHP